VLGRRVVLVEGRIQVMTDGALFDRPARWVLISRDELVWRYHRVTDSPDAYRLAASLGALDESEQQSPAWRITSEHSLAQNGVVEVEESAVVTLIRLQGEFDVGNCLELEGAVLGAVDRRLPLIVDFSMVEFVDSAGGRGLLMPGRQSQHPVVIVVPATNHMVSRIFDLLPLPEPFRRVSSADEAFSLGEGA